MVAEIAGQAIMDMPQELANRIGNLVTLLQAVGGVIIIYLVFNIINSFFNRKKSKELREINSNLRDIKALLARQDKRKKKK